MTPNSFLTPTSNPGLVVSPNPDPNPNQVFLELARLLGWLPELQAFEADLSPQSRELLQRAVAESTS